MVAQVRELVNQNAMICDNDASVLRNAGQVYQKKANLAGWRTEMEVSRGNKAYFWGTSELAGETEETTMIRCGSVGRDLRLRRPVVWPVMQICEAVAKGGLS
jgi:hypothetical protein